MTRSVLVLSWFLGVLGVFGGLSHAQVTLQPPPLARVEAVPARSGKPGGALSLVVKVTPREGIHIYAPPQKVFKPISLALEPAAGIEVGKVQFPAAVTRTFEGEAVKVFDGPFSILVPILLDKRATGTAALRGTLTYQACDDLICYRPVSVPVGWTIRVE